MILIIIGLLFIPDTWNIIFDIIIQIVTDMTPLQHCDSAMVGWLISWLGTQVDKLVGK